jgi:asparagine N-glycosylation enzyme membrane subunit Stt3
MADLTITSSNGLVQATVRQRQETYYLVTEDNLNSLKGKSILADIFVFISSLAWGAYFSIITTIKSIPEPKTQDDPVNKILLPLTTIENVFLWAGIIFTILTIWMFYQSFDQIKKIKTSGQISLEPNGQQ